MMGRSWFAATMALALLGMGVRGDDFYPANHFDYVTKITNVEALDSFVQDNISQDKTVFVRWIASSG